MFSDPLSASGEINKPAALFKYFQKLELTFALNPEQVNEMENYLNAEYASNIVWTGLSIFKKKILKSILYDEQYQVILSGFEATVKVLHPYGFTTRSK
jgi:hypothetical protein